MIDIQHLLRAFEVAKKVNHYYWMHTDCDDEDGCVSIENVRRIVERMTGVRLKVARKDVDARFVRSLVDRYPGSADIDLRKNQDEPWLRYSAIKEFSQILCDTDDQFQPDPLITLEEITSAESAFSAESPSEALQSEDIAEVLALEIIYPQEYRATDARFLDDGGTVEELVEKRKVPAAHIEQCTMERYYEKCQKVWKLIRLEPVAPLPEFKCETE